MNFEGKIYRPWPEAHSLLIPVTVGCTHNECTFCDMFREKKFRILPLEGVFADIEEARKLYSRIESMFLVDGNAMVLKTEHLLKILNKITATFPELRRIALYSGFNDLRRKSIDDLKAIKAAGVEMVYVGLETGDAETLEKIRKGMTPREAIDGMAHAKAAGIDVLVSIIFGIGGKERSREHIEETVRLLNIMEPEQIAPMALAIQPGTVLEEQVESGEFVQATPRQILEEEKYLLENLGDFDIFYWGDHGNNIVSLKGQLPAYRDAFIGEVDRAIAMNPVIEEKVLETAAW